MDAVFAQTGGTPAHGAVRGFLGVPFCGLFLAADLATRIARVGMRGHDASDAEAVVAGSQERYDLGPLAWARVDASGTPDATLARAGDATTIEQEKRRIMTIETFEVSSRTKEPLRKKLFPIWWFMNDQEPNPPDWYQPRRQALLRWVSWYLRNPLQNFGNCVLGVCDRNFTVYGTAPVMMVMWDDAVPPRKGWKWSIIKLGWLRLPFVSYSGWALFYAGWQPNGFFGFKLNIKDSAVQFW